MSSMLHGQPLTVDSLCQAALRGDLLAKDIITGVGAHVGDVYKRQSHIHAGTVVYAVDFLAL